MGRWKVIVPTELYNYAHNPSFVDGQLLNVTNVGGGLSGQSTPGKFSASCLYMFTNADNEGVSLDLETLPNDTALVTLWAKDLAVGGAWDWSLDNANYHTPTLVATDGVWNMWQYNFPAIEANGSALLYMRQNGAAPALNNTYIDGVMVESGVSATPMNTFIEGDLEGCLWEAERWYSLSIRTVHARAGGLIYDLKDDYGLAVKAVQGLGMSDTEISVDEFALLSGGVLNNIVQPPKVFTLTCQITKTTTSELRELRRALINLLRYDAEPQYQQQSWQPVRLMYIGDDAWRVVQAHYQSGLDLNWDVATSNLMTTEQAQVRFLCTVPYQSGYGATGKELGNAERYDGILEPNLRLVIRRDLERDLVDNGGTWNQLGVTAPNVGTVWAIHVASDGLVYIGGDFLLFNGVANANYIVAYDPVTGVFSALGTGMNGLVRTITESIDGDIWVGGDFTVAGGVAVNYVTYWDGAAFNAVGGGPGLNGLVWAIEAAPDGNVYIGGGFTDINLGPGGTYNYIISWNGAAWAPLGVGFNSQAIGLAYDKDSGRLYAVGQFTTAGGGAALYVAYWVSPTWYAMGSGFNALAYDVTVAPDGQVYAVGTFTTAGGNAANRIAVWNGSYWSALGSGLNANAIAIALGPDGVVYAGGTFTTAGGVTVDRMAKWTGDSWAALDMMFAAVYTSCNALAVGRLDPVVRTNYELYAGLVQTNVGNCHGGHVEVINNPGTAASHPIVTLRSYSAAWAHDHLVQIRNETTGMEILCDYELYGGDALTIDCRPAHLRVESSRFGSRTGAVLPNSDQGAFYLQPGDNKISVLLGETILNLAVDILLDIDVLYDGID